jgi:hypothetical protein
MTVLDLATLLARDLLDDIADSIADEIRQDTALRRRVTGRLRDELSAIEHRVLTEIRAEADAPPDSPAPSLTSTPRKGGGHENE